MADYSVLFTVIGLFILLLVFVYSFFSLRLWMAAAAARVPVSLFALASIKLRRSNPAEIVIPLIKAAKVGLDLNFNKLEGHYMAGGNVDRVVDALITAQWSEVPLLFERVAAIDLAQRDVLKALQMSLHPTVIELPEVVAVAKDDIEVKAKVKITVITNIDNLAGGAGEDTIIARAMEKIADVIGSTEDNKSVRENPNVISSKVFHSNLDEGTAYKILSIDVSDLSVGNNICAYLLAEQAEAEKRLSLIRNDHSTADVGVAE